MGTKGSSVRSFSLTTQGFLEATDRGERIIAVSVQSFGLVGIQRERLLIKIFGGRPLAAPTLNTSQHRIGKSIPGIQPNGFPRGLFRFVVGGLHNPACLFEGPSAAVRGC